VAATGWLPITHDLCVANDTRLERCQKPGGRVDSSSTQYLREQVANAVPGSYGSWRLFFLRTLETERAVKADFTPATQHDRGKAEAARRVEIPGHHAVQLPLKLQPILHHPTATSATAFLRRASAMGPRTVFIRT
jgi:hypothetical protein